MKCRDVDRLCTAYVDGELDDRRASALRGHVRTCESCRAVVEDEARLREAADELGPIDPPAELWAAVESQIAAAEIADSRRPRAWFWLQAARERALPMAVGVTCAVLVTLWLVRPGDEPEQAAVAPDQSAEVSGADKPDGDAELEPPMSLDESRRLELERADERYRKVIAELKEIAAEQRELMSDDEARELETRIDELERQAAVVRAGLQASSSLDPADRRALYQLYQAEIALLRRAAVAGVTR